MTCLMNDLESIFRQENLLTSRATAYTRVVAKDILNKSSPISPEP